MFLIVAGALLSMSVVFTRASGRIGVPVALVFLLVGMLAGTDGIGGIQFDDYRLAFRFGTVALVLILFDGGLNTPLSSLRLGLRPAAVLATLGVAGTAVLVGLGARLLGLSWTEAFLVGAVVSSTDAAAVFAVLRSSGIHLKRRVGITLELESGLNDPMAIILTMALTRALVADQIPLGAILRDVVVQLGVGAALGVAFGYLGRELLGRVHLAAGGLYPVLTLALAFLAFGVPTVFYGSGFLAVYIAAVILGNANFPFRPGVLRVHDATAWFSQVAMFLLLGLLVYPHRLLDVAPMGLALGLMLAFVARPLVVALCLAPFRYPMKEVAYVGWVGLRGAVPIILATFPVLARAPGAERIFDLVFFVVVVNVLVPGVTVRKVTQWLGLESREPPPPPALLEITSTQVLKGELLSFYVDPATSVSGAEIAQIPFPDGAAVMLVIRGHDLIAPRGRTVLQPGDHVYVFCRPEDRAFLQLIFGRAEE